MVSFFDMEIHKKVFDLNQRSILLFLLLPLVSLLLYLYIPTSSSMKLLYTNNIVPVEGKKLFGNNTGNNTRIAVCLVGGARRFELTGPSIIENILDVYPNSDLFLHSPLDADAYKLSLLKNAPRISAVKIFQQKEIPVTASVLRVLDAQGYIGKQRLLQYFDLVEGCLEMICDHQKTNNFIYDWIIRTRVDGFWSNPLGPESFVPGHYVVPVGSSFGGLNDRLGVGDFNTSKIALARLSLLPVLDSAGIRQANSEISFKAQLTTHNVKYIEANFPFCVMTNHRSAFPPRYHISVPVASISSPGPLSGAKCRVCNPICKGDCVGNVMDRLNGWGWTEWSNNTLELCDAHGDWEYGWENIFDKVASKKLADERKRINRLMLEECVDDFKKMKNRTTYWEAPQPVEICSLGLVFA